MMMTPSPRKSAKAKTDPEPLPETTDDLEGRLEAKNLVGIYAALADMTEDAVLTDFGGKQFGEFKPALAELAVSKLSPIRDRFEELRQDTTAIDGDIARWFRPGEGIGTAHCRCGL